MKLSEISPTKKETGLCVGGWHQYHNKKDKIPYAYALKILTTNPSVHIYVKLPLTEELKAKYKELKKRCITSRYNIVEVTFKNFNSEKYTIKDSGNGLEIIRYVASATDFDFVEDEENE